MKKALYAVYGASGYGREVLPLARAQLEAQGGSPVDLVVLDDNPSGTAVNGHRVMTCAHFLAEGADERWVAIAIANSELREKLAEHLAANHVKPWSVFARNVMCLDDVQIGEGAILNPFVTLTSNIRIGRQFHANIYSYVAHDCVIGDFVTFAPSVQCNGNVLVEDHAYLGTGAILKQGKPGQPLVIGKGAVVGMGAVVTKDVPPGATVVGNPARPLAKT
jgi:sugar O-acyltransferase (sialic acid O-acetyltransferase NeuD family)